MTRDAVARHVGSLERYLGMELFERRSHGLVPSARGCAFLVEVRHLLAALEKATERLRDGG